LLIWCVCVESISGAKIQFEDFARVYGEQLDRKLEFTTLEDSSMLQETSITSMTNAIKTFDHQGTGFISLNELKFSKARALIFKLKKNCFSIDWFG
jgi:Ca2+-binding EF-hand superfamily protein